MSRKTIFFAGGGTGGHIYPGIAVAERLTELDPEVNVHFFCSRRDIDAEILAKAGFNYTVLPALPFSLQPRRFIRFVSEFLESSCIAREKLARSDQPVITGVGGFVAPPACRAAHSVGVPVVLLSPDVIPGRANKLTARWADRILVQFEASRMHFGRHSGKVEAVGCPLRKGFSSPAPDRAVEQLGLSRDKYVLLVTGASSGARSVNEAVCTLLERIGEFAGTWQIVHVTGRANLESVRAGYASATIEHKLVDYFDNMADLLAAAELVIGRSGAVSVAEYAATAVPSICMPYPHHGDRHQYYNAEQLVNAGAAVVVDDLPDLWERSEWLWEELRRLLADSGRRAQMRENCKSAARPNAARQVAQILLNQPKTPTEGIQAGKL